MFRKFTSRTYCVLPAILCLSLSISVLTVLLSGCSKKEQNEPEQPSGEPQPLIEAVIILQTDSDEWQVQLFKEHLLYSEAVAVKLPAPWRLPDREEAKVLKDLSYPTQSGERFVTSDGYTFGMPSASVTKAGAKTKYSVLGLWRRKTIIDVPF